MRRAASVPLVLLLLLVPVAAQSGVIETIAGGGPNHVAATATSVELPLGVAVDGTGNLYIVSGGQSRVFKVDGDGVLTVVAGTGVLGFSGDGGPATEATLNSPFGVAVAANGDVFIAERGHRVRKVNSAGIITTVAGTGVFGFSGDGGPATDARLASPHDVGVDAAGNLFIAERDNNRIRRVDAASGTITTVAGGGASVGNGVPATSAFVNTPTGIAVDSAGTLFIAENFGNRIRKVSTAGIITTVAGIGGNCGLPNANGDDGPAVSARFCFPFGVEVDGSGNVYVVDTNIHRIRMVDTATGKISTVAGTIGGFLGDGGPATGARLRLPTTVAVDSVGNLFIADQANNRIRKVDTAGTITTVAGNGTAGFGGDDGAATSAVLKFPTAVAADNAGNIFIADRDNQRIRKVDAAGTITTAAGGLSFPSGVAVDAGGNLLIAETAAHRIRRVDAATGAVTTVAGTGASGFTGDGGSATAARLNSPSGVAVGPYGDLFIADTSNSRIRKVHTDGTVTTVAGGGFSLADGIAATSAGLQNPSGVAVDGSGNLLIADRGNRRIRKVDTAGIITTVAGNGASGFSGDAGPATSASLSAPTAVAVDSVGNVFIADRDNQRIRKVDTDGIISTVAGNGTFGFGGDGGPATGARLANPSGVAVDAAHNLLIADQNNHRIRRAVLNEPPVALAGPDLTLIVGEPGLFDGSASADPDGTIASFAWSFGDGAFADGPVVSHAYAAPGEYTVTLTVTDDQGDGGVDTAVVIVITPIQGIELLAALVQSFDLHHGIANSLDAKLRNARKALEADNAGQRQDARHKLEAFAHEVQAQRDKKLTGAQADELLVWAARISGVL